MKIYFKKEIENLKPYEIENRNYPILLDANESAFDFPNELKEKLLNRIKKTRFNRYPDGNATKLKKAIAKYLKVKEENLCIGNGSDEVLQYIIQVFCAKKDKVVFPVPSFSMYKILSLVSGAKPVSVNLRQNQNSFDLDLDTMLKEIKNSKVTIIPYPNNPTGNCFSDDKIKKIIEKRNSIVVIDEAYHEYCGKTFLPFIKKYENLIILRSFSKVFSMAGIRVGYAISNKNIIKYLEKVRLPYNINSISQGIAIFAIENKTKILLNIRKIIKERERLFHHLLKLKKVFPFKSDANFILLRIDNAKIVFKNLKKRGILVRNLPKGSEILTNCLRVSIGTKEENDIFLKELKKYEEGKD